MFSHRLDRLLILAQERVIMMGRKTPARTGTNKRTAWSAEVTIMLVELFFTVKMDAAVGSNQE